MAKDAKKDDAPQQAAVEEASVPKRMLVVETDGARVNVLVNTMGLWECKAILEAIFTGVSAQINRIAAPPPQGIPPVRELLDESAVADTDQSEAPEGAKEDVADLATG